jgi:hypothetical protein
VVNSLSGNDLKFFPMSIHHEWRSQLIDQRKDNVHVLNSLVKGKE